MALFYRPIQRYMRAEFNDSFVTFVLPSLVRLLLAFVQAYKQNKHTAPKQNPPKRVLLRFVFISAKRVAT